MDLLFNITSIVSSPKDPTIFLAVFSPIGNRSLDNIVSVNSIPDVRGYDVYDVVSFDELLDVKKNINKPIMHIVLKNGDVNLFFITKNNNMYEYMMRKKK